MSSERPRGDASDSTPALELSEFAAILRRSVQLRGWSLRTVRERLRSRGYEISVSTLSHWQSGTRRPERDTSFDAIRELEQLLLLEEGELTDALGPSRRVGHSPHRSFAALSGLPTTSATREPPAELIERSSTTGVFVDSASRITRTVVRTLWQSRRDGAQQAIVFSELNSAGAVPPEISGTIGCDVVDVAAHPVYSLVRTTLRLLAPLHQGELALTERRTIENPDASPEREFTVVAGRRQTQVLLFVEFDAERLPRRCRVSVETSGDPRVHVVALNGRSATHAEFNFGPGRITLSWEW